MASVTTQQFGIGNLSDQIRRLWLRLGSLVDESRENSEEIERLKQKAIDVETDIATLKEMADTQDNETADQHRRMAELAKQVEQLTSSVTAHELTLSKMQKKLHGEQVRRGLANARAERAEGKLAAKRRKPSR